MSSSKRGLASVLGTPFLNRLVAAVKYGVVRSCFFLLVVQFASTKSKDIHLRRSKRRISLFLFVALLFLLFLSEGVPFVDFPKFPVPGNILEDASVAFLDVAVRSLSPFMEGA